MLHVDGLTMREHTFRLPLDHSDPGGAKIDVFAREVTRTGKSRGDEPWLVYLQGGPGFESPRPISNGGWIGAAVDSYRVLLLDQRGTGRSTPVNAASLEGMASDEDKANFLAHFRADSIVRDCEAIRRELAGGERWSILGQSFGGFCAMHYLSTAPEGLAKAMITGGLPGIDTHADDVYRATYAIVEKKNRRFFRQFPGTEERLVRIGRRLAKGDVTLPCGDPLSLRRFQTIGAQLGWSYGAATLHFLLERAFVPGTEELSHSFLRGVENLQGFDTNPFYAVLHEACYAQGAATAWSAERVRAEFPAFDGEAALARGDAPLLTGETVYPWMLDEYEQLRPLKGAAELLARKDDWPALYDAERLAENEVPVAAVVYFDDMYVPASLSLATAERVRGLEPWVTNEYEHDGLRTDGVRVLNKLEAMCATGVR